MSATWTETTGWRPGGFWRRLLALVIDSAIIGLAAAALQRAAGGPDVWTDPHGLLPVRYGDPSWDPHWHRGATGGGGLLLDWLYFALFESSHWSATPGKKLLGMVVVDRDGRRIGFLRATGRFFAKFLSMIPLCLGFILAAWNPRKRALHDYLAGTLVIRQVVLYERVVPPGAT